MLADRESVFVWRAKFETRSRNTESPGGVDGVARAWDMLIKGHVTEPVQDNRNLQEKNACQYGKASLDDQEVLLTLSMYESA